jgi:TIR domain-containing protein/pentapeptide repeat protein
MANPEHLTILKQGVNVWNTWRQEFPAVRPALSKVDLSEADLRGADFSRADLSGADLSRADLTNAHLIGADLSDSHLRGAHLNGAHLNGAAFINADLRVADLSGALLNWALLIGADLKGAILTGADLTGADLTGANLNRTTLHYTSFSSARAGQADFTEALVWETMFADMNLSEAKGLETIRHLGPSTIGIDTIFQSQGNIPEVFLRGAGVPEILITYLPSLLSKPIQFYSCFISYSHEDKVFARRLHDTLQGRGIRCWLDEYQLLPGDDIYEQVDRGIRLWDKVLLCCSESSLKSWWVENEIDIAFGKEQELMKERGKGVLALIPLNLDGYLFKWENGRVQQVKKRLAPDFTGWEKNNSIFEKQVERVVKALMADDAGRELPPPSRL